MQLFIERAQAVRHDLPLDKDAIAAIAEICRRLDGLPLAIELAAARAKIFSPQAILARLGNRLDLLKSAERDRPARHQTLRQALAWSYDLLDEREQRVFRRAGVFAASFTVEALEVVCGADCGDVLDAVSTLVDHSLFVRTEGPGADARFLGTAMAGVMTIATTGATTAKITVRHTALAAIIRLTRIIHIAGLASASR